MVDRIVVDVMRPGERQENVDIKQAVFRIPPMSDSTRDDDSLKDGGAMAEEERELLAGSLLVEHLNRGYVCPGGGGAAWRAAQEAGVDMALIEDALRMPAAQRLRVHQRALNLVMAIADASPTHDSGNRKPA
jgi:hypothetical protein